MIIKNAPQNITTTEYLGKNLKINNIDAFDSSQIENYNVIDKEFSDKLNAVSFELNYLVQQKNRALVDFNITNAVKINDKIANLNVKLAELNSQIGQKNNEIADIELDFQICN